MNIYIVRSQSRTEPDKGMQDEMHSKKFATHKLAAIAITEQVFALTGSEHEKSLFLNDLFQYGEAEDKFLTYYVDDVQEEIDREHELEELYNRQYYADSYDYHAEKEEEAAEFLLTRGER